MGILSDLGNAWSNWSTDWSKVWNSTWDQGVQNVWHGLWQAGAAALNGAMTPMAISNSPDENIAAKQRLYSGLQQALSGVGGTLSGVGEVPLIRQIGQTSAIATHEAGRLTGTAALQGADVFNKGLGTLTSGSAWQDAYNSTRYVTAGQAAVFAGISAGHRMADWAGLNPDDPAKIQDAQNKYGTFGVIAQGPAGLDPRVAANQDKYLNNTWLSLASGTLDATNSIFADPTQLLGAGARAAKLKYFSQQMGSGAVQKLLNGDGKWASFTDSNAYQKTYDFIKNADSAERVRQTILNNHVNGGVIANALWSVSDDPQLYSQTFRALYGDPQAWQNLVDQAPRIADIVGTKAANYSIAQVAKNYGLGDAEIDKAASNLVETKTDAFVDAMANGKGAWGALNPSTGGLLTGQTLPRLRMSSQWRVGVNTWLNFAPSTMLGYWANSARNILPSAKGGRQLDLDNPDSLRIFRDNLLQSRLDQPTVDDLVGAYGRASTRESRSLVAGRAEDLAFQAHAAAHGVQPEDVEKILPMLNQYRTSNRAILGNSQMYLSSAARRQGQQYLAQGLDDAAKNSNALADSLDRGAQLGTQPRSVMGVLDQDGSLALVPVEPDLTAPSTAMAPLESQHRPIHMLPDWGALDSALWWQGKGALGKGVWATREATSALAEAANSVWKISAIMRPGYIWRTLSDELGGPLAVMGAHGAIAASTEGAQNAFANTWSRGRLMPEAVRSAWSRAKATHLGTRNAPLPMNGKVVDEAPSAGAALMPHGNDPDLAGYAFRGQGALTYEDALAEGVISVPQFMDRIMEHGDNGTLPRPYQSIHASLTDPQPTITKREAQQAILDRAMSSVGRDVYQSPSWQQSFIESANEARLNKPAGVPGTPIVVDPFSGTSPKIAPQNVSQHFTLGDTQRFPAQQDQYDQVYKFIHKHADALLSPSNLMHAYVQPDGNLALSVARYTGEGAVEALKPGFGKRVTIPFTDIKGKDYRASGQAGLDVKVGPNPEDYIHLRGAFQGQEGDLFQRQVAGKDLNRAWIEHMADTNQARLMADSGQWVNQDPSSPGYNTAWERATNLQLANDAVARQFMEGRSISDVIAWMHNETPGRAYQARMGPYLSQYYQQVHMIKGMVDTYVGSPGALLNPSRPEESQALIKAVLDHSATVDDHLAAVVDRDSMPQVHGPSLSMATGKGYFMRKVNDWTEKSFKYLSDIPNDRFLRFPFAADRYNYHANQLIGNRATWLNQAGDVFTQDDLDKIEGLARQRALVDVRRYLFDTMAQSDLAKGMRLMVPFGSALMDSAQKWGVVLRENPARAANVWKVWSAPDKAGMVQDQDGNQLEVQPNGKEVWYSVDPKTGARTAQPDSFVPNGKQIVFRLPFGVPTIDGTRMNVNINKTAFQTFLDMPSFGPIIAVPANRFSLSNPEFASNKFVQSFILPYGPSNNSWTAAVPGNVRNFKDAWDAFMGKDTALSEQQAMSVYATEMVNYSKGTRSNAPTFEEARQKAAQMQGLRFMSRLSGVTSSFTSPYQPYIDYYHMLEAKKRQPGDPTADQEFYNTMGPEFFMLTYKVTKNVMGIPATVGAYNQYNKFKDLMQQYPDLAPLISGADGAGTFNKAVYEAQKNTPVRYGSQNNMRQPMTLSQSVEDAQTRLGWVRWTQFSDALHADMSERGITSLAQKGAEDLAANKAEFLKQQMYWQDPYGAKQISPWYKAYSTMDQSKIESQLTQMRQIVQDPRLQGREDMRGLIDYLHARDNFKQYMADMGVKQLGNPNTTSTSAASQQAGSLALQWDAFVFGLKEQSLAFSQLYDRYLTHDSNLAAS